MKVYVVTRGQYSDHRVDCVFKSRKAADEYVDRHNRADKYGYYDWEEYEVDASAPRHKTDQIAFEVSYWPESRWASFTDKWVAEGHPDADDLEFTYVQQVTKEYSLGPETSWRVWVWAKDEQEAKKIGADKIMPVYAASEGVAADEPGRGALDLVDTPFINFLAKTTMGDYTIDGNGTIWRLVPADDDAEEETASADQE